MSMRKRSSYLLLLVIGLLGELLPGPGKAPASSSVDDRPDSGLYRAEEIEGWTVYVKRDFLKRQPSLAPRTLTLLRLQLFQIARIVPAGAVRKLRTVRIWVEENDPSTPCMAYHPGAGWLREHHTNPAMAGGVELANARNFLNWTLEQPSMVLHEMTHAYHHKFLPGGFENLELKAAYENAMKNKIYESVLKIANTEEKAYAANNPQEYFAEATEAFFGTNDFYPFVRSELRRHDPTGYDVLKKVWGEKADRAITEKARRADDQRLTVDPATGRRAIHLGRSRKYERISVARPKYPVISCFQPIAGSAGGTVSSKTAGRRGAVSPASFSAPASGQCSRRTSSPLTTTNGHGGASVQVPLFTYSTPSCSDRNGKWVWPQVTNR